MASSSRDPYSFNEEEVITYANLKSQLCTTVRGLHERKPDMVKFCVECKAELDRPIANVRASALAGNLNDCLEMGLRTYAGAEGTAGSPNDAMLWWNKAAGARSMSSVSPVSTPIPRGVEARAWSCLAHAHDEIATEDDGTVSDVDTMHRAASCAERACSLGFVSPTIHILAIKIRRLSTEFPSSDPEKSFDAPRFKKLTYLWEAHQRIQDEIAEETKVWEAKMAKHPEAYRCAAPGCGIRATRRSGLKKCAGKCSADRKPSYCSKECQRADWKRHKPVCLGLTDAPTAEEEQSPSPAESGSDIKYTGTETKEFKFRPRGQELSMDLQIGGQTITFSSSTMSPEFMKSLRDAAMKSELAGRR